MSAIHGLNKEKYSFKGNWRLCAVHPFLLSLIQLPCANATVLKPLRSLRATSFKVRRPCNLTDFLLFAIIFFMFNRQVGAVHEVRAYSNLEQRTSQSCCGQNIQPNCERTRQGRLEACQYIMLLVHNLHDFTLQYCWSSMRRGAVWYFSAPQFPLNHLFS